MFKIQSIIFDKKYWSKKSSKKWLQDHGYYTSLDEKPLHLRYRQQLPSDFIKTSFKTKVLNDGIELIIGKLKKS